MNLGEVDKGVLSLLQRDARRLITEESTKRINETFTQPFNHFRKHAVEDDSSGERFV